MDLHNDYQFDLFSFPNSHHVDFRKGSPFHYLLLVAKGSGRITTQADSLSLQIGDICYVPKGLRCQWIWQGDPDIQYLSFGFRTFPPANQKAYTLQVIPRADELAAMLRSIDLESHQISGEMLSRFYRAISEATDRMRFSSAASSHPLAEHAMAYIRQHPHATISDIAHICGVSQSHLYAEFRSATGTTPNKFRNSILCDQAVELLTTTQMTVEDISDMLQFSSPSYFRKVIRQVTGYTPRQIRRCQEKT